MGPWAFRAFVLFYGLGAFAADDAQAVSPGAADFASQVAPILQRHCIRCHQPGNEKGDLSLATMEDLREQGHIVPGDPAASRLIEVVAAVEGTRPEMPKDGEPLSPVEFEQLRQWITTGATWPDGVVVRQASKADRSWWSLQPLGTVEPPHVDGLPAGWGAHPIDQFIGAKLIEQGLAPNPPADRRTLIRRVTYDLTGLPPTPDEVADFVADESPEAYAELIDRLLASPRYGERWGRHWLDVVRFGESRGYERNEIITNLWPFRDYVIRSLNEDKPFDQFIGEHLAGDVLAPDVPDVEVGSAFLVAGPYDDVGNQDAVQARQIRANTLDEIITATSEAFLGLTLGCARCHDHKFDPLRQEDYYAWYATFSGIRHGTREVATREAKSDRAVRVTPLAERKAALTAERATLEGKPEAQERLTQLQAELKEVEQQLAAVPALPAWWIGTRSSGDAQGPFHVFLGGSPERKGTEVMPASLSALSPVETAVDSTASLVGFQLPADAPEADRRRALADWIVDPHNPLTSRVLANRVWHYHFGTGIVDTPSDFGYMGGRPTHPELLDWLAGRLLAHGWQLKPLHREILLSQTYQQASDSRPEAAQIDGDSRLLWRYPPRRLSAEEVRDTLLAVSGRLNLDMGGPGFKLYQYLQDNVATYVPLDTHGPETYRRAVYHHNARAARTDLMTDFDQPDCAFSSPKRAETTTPLQALTMLNHQFTLDMARFLAEHVQAEAGSDPAQQINTAFLLCYQRAPTDDEAAACRRVCDAHGLAAVCRMLLNTSELVYVE